MELPPICPVIRRVLGSATEEQFSTQLASEGVLSPELPVPQCYKCMLGSQAVLPRGTFEINGHTARACGAVMCEAMAAVGVTKGVTAPLRGAARLLCNTHCAVAVGCAPLARGRTHWCQKATLLYSGARGEQSSCERPTLVCWLWKPDGSVPGAHRHTPGGSQWETINAVHVPCQPCGSVRPDVGHNTQRALPPS
jgi:hypothetical protein